MGEYIDVGIQNSILPLSIILSSIVLGIYALLGVETENDTVGKVSEISALLNIHKTRKNKKILENSRKNPLMAGFPNHALKKFIRVLIKNGYTIVLIEQVTPAPNPDREVTKIYSPTTYIDETYTEDNNFLMSIYLEQLQSHKSNKRIWKKF